MFRSLGHVFMVCQLGGYTQDWDTFTKATMKDLKPYIDKGSRLSSKALKAFR